MKPAAFELIRVRDEAALCAALAEHAGEARILAGGQSLVPMMNFRVATPSVMIDVNGIRGLASISVHADHIELGALVRHADVEDSAELQAACPLLRTAVRHVAHRTVRNRGTLGGTLALCYPGAEMPLALVALGATIALRSSRGERMLAAEDFLRGMLDTALEEDEYIRCVRIPRPSAGARFGFFEVSRRHGDFALAVAAVVLQCDDTGRVQSSRAAVSGGLAAPTRVPSFEQALATRELTASVLRDESRAAATRLAVFGDHQYPEPYRRHLLAVALERAAGQALAIGEFAHVA